MNMWTVRRANGHPRGFLRSGLVGTDHIQLPPEHAFSEPPEYAAVALHELSHWTGHKTRLDREDAMKARYGSAAYSLEELRAELSCAFIAADLGIPSNIPQNASYIGSWLKPLKEDKREIFRTAADAQRIVDMVLGFHPDFVVKPEPHRPTLTEVRPFDAEDQHGLRLS
jgi:antirestriction protein ArdC